MFGRPFALPFMFRTHRKKARGRADFSFIDTSGGRRAAGSFRGHPVEELISSGSSAWNRTSKLIWRRLRWHRRALICCQCDEDGEPNTPPAPPPDTEPLIRETFSLPTSPITRPPWKGHRGRRCLYTANNSPPLLRRDPASGLLTRRQCCCFVVLVFAKGDETLSPCRTRAQQ